MAFLFGVVFSWLDISKYTGFLEHCGLVQNVKILNSLNVSGRDRAIARTVVFVESLRNQFPADGILLLLR